MATQTLTETTVGYMLWEQNLCLLLEADNLMFTPAPDTSADLAIALLIHYSFDLSGYSASDIVDSWQKQYPLNWLHFAVIEALYQGRYKAVSVQQILNLWQRRGQATFHFNMEFETMICSKFPEKLTSVSVLPTVEKNSPTPEAPKDSRLGRGGEGSQRPTLNQSPASGNPRAALPHRAERSRLEGNPPGELRSVPSRSYPATGNPSSPDGDAPQTALALRQSPTGGNTHSVLAPVEATGVEKERGGEKISSVILHREGSKKQLTEDTKNLEDARTPRHRNAGSVENTLNSKDLGRKLTPPASSHIPPSNQEALPPATSNHPPIGQFTPETSACSDSFTSKLKAMSNGYSDE